MSALIWASLAVFLVASIVGLVFAARRGLAAWRTLRACQRTLEPAIADMNARVEAMQTRVEAAPGSSARVERATQRLQKSLEEARIISEAFQDARPLVRALRLLRS